MDWLSRGDALLYRLEVAGVSQFDVEHPNSVPAVVDPDARAAIETLAELGAFAGCQMNAIADGELAEVPLSLVGLGG
jgi:hypothetical protein